MAKKLVIVMANTDPRNGEELGAPFFQATVAAAMDYEVEVICTASRVNIGHVHTLKPLISLLNPLSPPSTGAETQAGRSVEVAERVALVNLGGIGAIDWVHTHSLGHVVFRPARHIDSDMTQ